MRCQSLKNLASSIRLCESPASEDVEGRMLVASSDCSDEITRSMLWFSNPGLFSIGNSIDLNIGEGF